MRVSSWNCGLVLWVAIGACSPRPALVLGDECELATQCAAPLVCRLGHCRDECRLNRDCRAGLVCLRDENGLGACQLPDQDRCALSSECTPPLICLMGHCSVACMRDVDCPAGSRCVDDGSGGNGCQDAFMMRCEYDSECGDVLICAPDGVCREQCHTDRDCRDGLVCDRTASPTVCIHPPDAGTPSDAGTPDDVGVDAPSPGLDSGLDAGIDAFVMAPDVGLDAFASADTGIDAATITTGPAPIPLLVAGQDHACATAGGQLRCWGGGTSGQIGDNGNVDRPTPVALGLTNVVVLATGGLHSCAFSSTSGLACWGAGAGGQIGDNNTLRRSVPTTVSGVSNVTWLAAGGAHTCALSAGAVLCWGQNGSGEVGDGTTTRRTVPTPTLPLAAPAVEITARAATTCARLNDGRVQCWGDDQYGQLAVDLSPTNRSATPLFIPGITNAVEVVLGSQHGCVRLVNGVVECWGNDGLEQLGDGPGGTGARLMPAPTIAMPPAVELAAAADHTCARTIDGDVYCWGENTLGQCGRDPFASPTASVQDHPMIVPGISGVTELTTGDNHTCARNAAGVWCWGINTNGNLGDTTTAPHYAPARTAWP